MKKTLKARKLQRLTTLTREALALQQIAKPSIRQAMRLQAITTEAKKLKDEIDKGEKRQ